jgi:hypothetical protein
MSKQAEKPRSPTSRLGVKELDRQVSNRLNLIAGVEEDNQEKWDQATKAKDNEAKNWMVAEALLRKLSGEFLGIQLHLNGNTLADFIPRSYNNGQVARDSDGHSLDNVAEVQTV